LTLLDNLFIIKIKIMDETINPKERVVHPSHYNKGIEMWDYAYTHKLDFFEGNIVKYVTRWKHKNGIEDLRKAKQYLDKLIELHEDNSCG
jgi:hypothetical protein